MRLEEEQSEREPFDAHDLQAIFNAPLFTEHELPVGAKGDAGIWLPLLALYGGARQAEYAGLRVSDIREDDERAISQSFSHSTASSCPRVILTSFPASDQSTAKL